MLFSLVLSSIQCIPSFIPNDRRQNLFSLNLSTCNTPYISTSLHHLTLPLSTSLHHVIIWDIFPFAAGTFHLKDATRRSRIICIHFLPSFYYFPLSKHNLISIYDTFLVVIGLLFIFSLSYGFFVTKSIATSLPSFFFAR